MRAKQFDRRFRWAVAIFTLAGTLQLPANAAGPAKGLFRKRTSVDVLAKHITKMEREIDYTGSIVAKVPDVWGQARLTQHREEFERQMRDQLNAFTVNLNADLSRSDQAYLSEAMMLAAGVNQSNSGAAAPTATTSPIDISTISNMVSPINGTPQTTDAGKQAQAQAGSTFTVVRTNPIQSLNTSFPAAAATVTLEPEIILDQRKRFLNHLHEIRRINEGDDSADAPGYSLNLVRIPVSVLPGDRTREGYGAEIAITATAHLTEELLPQTFRSLVVNDLVDQLSFPIVKYLEAAWPYLVRLEELELQIKAAEMQKDRHLKLIRNLLEDIKKTGLVNYSMPEFTSLLNKRYRASNVHDLGISQDNTAFLDHILEFAKQTTQTDDNIMAKEVYAQSPEFQKKEDDAKDRTNDKQKIEDAIQ